MGYYLPDGVQEIDARVEKPEDRPEGAGRDAECEDVR